MLGSLGGSLPRTRAGCCLPQLWTHCGSSVTGQTQNKQHLDGSRAPSRDSSVARHTSRTQLGWSPCGTHTPQPDPIRVLPMSQPRTSKHTGNAVNREPGWARAACCDQTHTQGQARTASILLSLCGRKSCGCSCHGAAALPLSQRTQGKQSATYFVCL